MAKIGFVSLGCAKNLVDTEVMLGLLKKGGHQITPSAERAEIIVVNTCGFIDPAKEESIQTILEMSALKKSGRCRRLIVAGCLVERYREEIRQEIPEVDAVIGVNEVPDILKLCAEQMSVPSYEGRELFLYGDADPRLRTTPPYTAYIKIAEGCDHPCSFCVIPQMRGPFRSRPAESVLSEARKLAADGVREINLIAQDSTMYGWDRGDRRGLANLIRGLGQVEDLSWVRCLYAYPNSIYPELLDAIAETDNACKYIDLPLQHASRGVLRSMKRGSHRQALHKLVERIRTRIPGVAIRTTFIVGFPGEQEEDFKELLGFVKEAEFDRLGVFIYSDEREAAAFELEGRVAEPVKEERRKRLMRLQRHISAKRNRQLLGQRRPVLVEGPSQETDLLWQGRLATQAPDIDGVVYLNDGVDEQTRPGDIRTVQINQAYDYDLVGSLLSEPERLPAIPETPSAENVTLAGVGK